MIVFVDVNDYISYVIIYMKWKLRKAEMKAFQLGAILLLVGIATGCGGQYRPVDGASGSNSSGAPGVNFDGALGANFNGEYQDVHFDDLTNAGTHWVRGFMNMTAVDPENAGAQLAISTSLTAENKGLHTILTLKWPFQNTGIPAPGSQQYAATVAQLDSVLPLVMGKVDILEVGNEPYWETPAEERDSRLNDFYEAMALHIIAFREAHCPGTCLTHIFMGALNQLNVASVQQSPWVERWMQFAHDTPQIDGVDIHPHVDSLDASRPFVDYVVQRLRPDQKFLATEFSLVWDWKAHMDDPVPAQFAQRYGKPSNMLVWQAIADAIQTPYTQQEWNDLLTLSPWFAAQSNYLDEEMTLFRSTGKLAVACYGFEQAASMTANFGANSVPWLLNSVYAGRTVQPNADGSTPTNPYWLAAFQRLNSE